MSLQKKKKLRLIPYWWDVGFTELPSAGWQWLLNSPSAVFHLKTMYWYLYLISMYPSNKYHDMPIYLFFFFCPPIVCQQQYWQREMLLHNVLTGELFPLCSHIANLGILWPCVSPNRLVSPFYLKDFVSKGTTETRVAELIYEAVSSFPAIS